MGPIVEVVSCISVGWDVKVRLKYLWWHPILALAVVSNGAMQCNGIVFCMYYWARSEVLLGEGVGDDINIQTQDVIPLHCRLPH